MMTDPIVRIDDGVDEGPLERLSRFRDALNTSLSQYPSVAIDLSEVRDPDIRFVQIIEAARIHAAATRFDMIVTDLNMPNMDGLTMIRELRKLPAHMGVPVIFLTTESDGEIKQQAKAAGATGWLPA